MLSWLPAQASSFGGEIDDLIALIYALTVGWFLLLHGLLAFLLIRFRRRDGVRARPIDGRSRRQLAWVVVPAVIVLILDLVVDERGAHVWAAVKRTSPPADLTLQVTASQFNWEVRYPGPDGQFGTRDDRKLDNSIVVPADRVVRVELRSKDVLHSLFLPELRLKQDAMPGRMIPVWFEAVRPGTYTLACAELCGFGHTKMGGKLKVLDEAGWNGWVASKWPAPAAAGGQQ